MWKSSAGVQEKLWGEKHFRMKTTLNETWDIRQQREREDNKRNREQQGEQRNQTSKEKREYKKIIDIEYI